MQNALTSAPSSPFASAFPLAPASRSHERVDGVQSDHRFVTLLDLYRGSGGLARAPEVASLFMRRCGDDVAVFAGWILKREVICFEWHSKMWLPLFQFSGIDMAPPPILSQVLAELVSVYDQWDVANWFVQPQLWLAQRTPIDLLVSDPLAVLNAARAVRFVPAD